MKNLVIILSILAFSATVCTAAQLRLPSIYSDDMVVQRDQPFLLRGWAAPDRPVKVEFAGKSASAVADSAGNWRVSLPPVSAGTNLTLVVTSDKETIRVKNVAVGEVWLCSGQSNMAFTVDKALKSEIAEQQSENAHIRLFSVPKVLAKTPADDVKSIWMPCTGNALKTFSAVGYWFGNTLQKELKVPVGLIDASWGGTPAEAWMSEPLLKKSPYKEIIDTQSEQLGKAEALYEKRLAAWTATGKGTKPRPPKDSARQKTPFLIFNGMISPLAPFPLRGVIWYQGEANGTTPERGAGYKTLLSGLIAERRQMWQTELPFGIVQLANLGQSQTEMVENNGWPAVRQGQLSLAQTDPRCGLAVTCDIGEADNIHPKNKPEVSRRLSAWALNQVYGRIDLPYCPIPVKMTRDGRKAVVEFKPEGTRLNIRGEVRNVIFALRDAKGEWYPAKAITVDNKLVLESDKVVEPVAVAYGQAKNPPICLFSEAGFPAPPFIMQLTP